MNRQEELAHYGIKGMKWGVRRTPEQLGRGPRIKKQLKAKLRINTPKRLSSASSKDVSVSESSTKKKSVKSMSDDELRKAINRIEMERKYTSLTAKQKSKGRKFVEEVLAQSAKQTATKYTTQAMTKLVDSLINTKKKGTP